jgi:release factor glutamine methyltransferase
MVTAVDLFDSPGWPSTLPAGRAALGKLLQAGFGEPQVARWFGVPLVTDARYVPSTARKSVRKGIGGWIAVLVGGETLPASDLGILDDAAIDALVESGFLERQDQSLRARVALLPVMGLLLASDRIDEAGADSVVMIDLSALNLARCLPPSPGATTLDVGCGAGLLALLCARAGADALGSDIDRRSLAAAQINAELNALQPRWFVSDLMKQVPTARFDLVTFNAPLLRAPLANADPAAPSSYYTSERGEPLALEFFAELPSHLGKEALMQAQLTPGVESALENLARDHQVGSIRFAEAPDGTPHAVIVVRKGEPMRRKLSVTLGPLCPVIDRRIVEALLAPRELRPELSALPAPWLELRESRQLDPRAARPWRQLRFGAHLIDDEELKLLENLDGRPIGDLNPAQIEMLRRLVDLGLVIVS